jgi:hypothetical protein
MSNDPIIDELHRQRSEEMERFNFDFTAFYEYLKGQERESGEPLVHPPEPVPNHTVQRTRVARR